MSVGVLRTKKVPNKYLLNGLVNEWNLCNAQYFFPFLRSVSLLSTRRCSSWHCHREGESQWSGYWWKCTVILWHHRWRWNSALWNHFRCPGPGWHYKTKKGKLRKGLFIFQIPLWNLSFEVDRSWVHFFSCEKVESFLHLIPLAPLSIPAKAMPSSYHGVASFASHPSFLSHLCPIVLT